MEGKFNIGNKIKRIRENSGLSQEQVAEYLGVDQSYISKCERGERQFSVDILQRLGNLFGVMTKDLISEDESYETLNFAFRSGNIDNDDLIAISEINNIALNIKQMRMLMG